LKRYGQYGRKASGIVKKYEKYGKSFYFEYLINEIGINSNISSNTTYKPTSFDKDEIIANH
jgi:hypothetical protein